jgi:hypothetical protein
MAQSFFEGLREKTVSGEETLLGTVSRATPFPDRFRGFPFPFAFSA